MHGAGLDDGSGRMMPAVVMLILLAGSLVMSGCGSAPPPIQTEMVPYTPDEQAARMAASSAVYRIRTGDRLAVDFKYEDELDSGNILVLPDGRVTLPGGVDPVLAKGRSIAELDSVITHAYAADYRNPQLSVLIESLADLNVYVLGMVRTPGQVSLPPEGMGVLQAVARAGGFDKDAMTSETVVIRATEEGFMLRRVDLSHLEHRGIADVAFMDLQPYDIIYVPRSPTGDFSYFSNTVLRGALNITQIFWEVYAIANIDRVQTFWR